MSNSQRITLNETLWIVGATMGVLALIPALAAFGMLLQFGFVAVMPLILVGTIAHAFFSRKELSMMRVHGLEVPENLPMHPGHSWARRESSSRVLTGIDDFAQHVIGGIDAIETGAVGMHVQEGEVIAVLRHGEREIPVHAPIEGTISEVNPDLAADASIVNRSPYEEGWLVALAPNGATLKTSLKNLLGGTSAIQWMRSEVERLVALTSPPELGTTMADGGEVGTDLADQLDEATWRKVKAAFFI